MDRKGSSILQVMLTDYGAMVSAIGIFALWGFLAFDVVSNSGRPGGTWLYIVIALTPICLGVIFWRLGHIRSLFENGREVQGSLTQVSFFRDRGRITYIYSINGERYQSSSMVSRSRRTAKLGPGQDVLLLVDPDKPKSAIIRELYV